MGLGGMVGEGVLGEGVGGDGGVNICVRCILFNGGLYNCTE